MKFIKKIAGKSHHNIYDKNTLTTIRMTTTIETIWDKIFINGTPTDYEAAFELASNGAQSGCNDSKALLAVCLYYGCGCTKNVDDALMLAKESADQGNKYGHLIYGRILFWKSDKSRVTAVEHYMSSAQMGLKEGLLTIGHMYVIGLYLPVDKQKGLGLIMKVANQNYGPAYEQLGRCYEIGDGVPVNKSEAKKLYKMAVDAGFTFSQNGLDRLRDS